MANFNVTQAIDNGLGDTEGTLSWAILQANTDGETLASGDPTGRNDTITLQTDVQIDGVMTTLLNSNIKIIGNGFTIDGDSTDEDTDGDFRPLFVKSGEVILSDLTVTNGLAQGGGSDQGGGGAGMGGALFIYDGDVTLNNVSFSNNAAIGGDSGVANFDYGGGGLYGNSIGDGYSGTGGGGLFASSTDNNGAYGGNGNYGGFGGSGSNGGNGGFGGGGYGGDAYGPISDLAGGFAVMADLPPEVRERTDKLDAVGNTTAAIGKGVAIGAAALTALGLFAAYMTQAGVENLDVANPTILSGVLIGAMLPYVFSAMAMGAVGRAAAGEWADRMLPLPQVLAGKGDASHAEIAKALGTTGYFIEHRLIRGLGDRPMPVARARLIEAIIRAESA